MPLFMAKLSIRMHKQPLEVTMATKGQKNTRKRTLPRALLRGGRRSSSSRAPKIMTGGKTRSRSRALWIMDGGKMRSCSRTLKIIARRRRRRQLVGK